MSAPAWNRHRPEVPFDKGGNMLHYPMYRDCTWDVLWPFDATMEVDGMMSGRSAKYLILKDVDTGKEYPMFVSDLIDFIQNGGIVKDGRLTTKWMASKKGTNYGIRRCNV